MSGGFLQQNCIYGKAASRTCAAPAALPQKKRPLMRMAQAGTFQIQGLPLCGGILCRGVAGIVEVFGIWGDLSAFLGDGRGLGARGIRRAHFLVLHIIHNGIRRGGDRRDLNLHIAVAQGGQVPLAVLAAGKDIVHILRRLSGRGQGQLTGGVVRGGGHIADRDDALAVPAADLLDRRRVLRHRAGDRHQIGLLSSSYW